MVRWSLIHLVSSQFVVAYYFDTSDSQFCLSSSQNLAHNKCLRLNLLCSSMLSCVLVVAQLRAFITSIIKIYFSCTFQFNFVMADDWSLPFKCHHWKSQLAIEDFSHVKFSSKLYHTPLETYTNKHLQMRRLMCARFSCFHHQNQLCFWTRESSFNRSDPFDRQLNVQ